MFVPSNTAGSRSVATGTQTGVCECCRRLDNDAQPKPVTWCGLCQAWLCGRCRGDLFRRARAALTGR